MLEGEWLVKFYAPWCPACQSLVPVWQRLSDRSTQLGITVADVDVTENAALSGRFFVTALPTIYHVKDGVFRQYLHSRTEQDLFNFVIDKRWKGVEPLTWYQSPTAFHMAALGLFFQFSVEVRNLHTTITTDYAIPVWGSYLIIAVATILVGLALGLFFVCLCDAVCPRRVSGKPAADGLDSDEAAGDVINDDESDVHDDRDTGDDSSGAGPRAETGAGAGAGASEAARRRNIPH